MTISQFRLGWVLRVSRFDRFLQVDRFLEIWVGRLERISRFDRFEPFERFFFKKLVLGRFGLTPFRFLRKNFDQNVHFQLDTVLQLETLSRTQFAFSV